MVQNEIIRYAAFIMTFNRPAILKQTIERLVDQTCPPEWILVVDNGNSVHTRDVVDGFPHLNIEYAGLPENTGPAGAAHHGLGALMAQGYEWIYWGDDDDPPQNTDTVERLLVIAGQNSEENIGAVGEVGQRFDWRKGVISRLADSELAGNVEVDVIAGGQQLLLNSAALKVAGLPRRDLFFGFEEPELCLRLRRSGYKLLIDGDRMKEARIRAGRFGKSVKTSATDRPLESLWRNYYGVRNFINIMRTTFQRPDLARNRACKEFVKSALAFKHGCGYGIAFAKMSLLGVVHGYTGKMGRTIEPNKKFSE